MQLIFKAASIGLTPLSNPVPPFTLFYAKWSILLVSIRTFPLTSLISNTCIFSGPPSCTGLKNHLAPRQLVCIMIFIHMMSLPGPPSGAIFSANPGCFSAGSYILHRVRKTLAIKDVLFRLYIHVPEFSGLVVTTIFSLNNTLFIVGLLTIKYSNFWTLHILDIYPTSTLHRVRKTFAIRWSLSVAF